MSSPTVNALVLAAGRSSRMGGPNKLLATFDGKPLIRHTVEIALSSRAKRVCAVVGHQADQVLDALAGCDVAIAKNPDFAAGLSTSLKLGFRDAALNADGVLVLLGDQPALRTFHLDALISAFARSGSEAIIVAASAGEWGNPVILPARFAADIEAITGDRGARALLQSHAALIHAVEIGPPALLDVDTPEALKAAGGSVAPDAPPGRS